MTAVWSEVDPALTSYTDCTYCSLLMVLVASGFMAFPLGIYTHEERRAFRGGDARLNFAGGVASAAARYGVTIQSPFPYDQQGLQAALAAPGNAYAVAGRTANFPAGHLIRRWDPAFAGFHAVCVIPQGNGQVLWLDPLAPMGFAGDTVSVTDVTNVFAAGNYPNDARCLPVTLGGDMTLKGTPLNPIHNRKTTLSAGGAFVRDPTGAPYDVITSYQPGQLITPTYLVKGNPILGSDQWYGLFEPAQRGTAPIEYGYLSVGLCNPLVPIEAGDTDAAFNAGVDAAAAKAAEARK